MTTGAGAVSAGGMAIIAALLEQRTGQQIDAGRAWRIESSLRPLLATDGIDTLDTLARRLLADRAGALATRVVDALLNQETSFFRDPAVLDLAADAAVEMQARAAGRRLRVWCAGCSSGQEPLSLAMLFDERLGGAAPMPDIQATDVSPLAIARARAGRYSQFEIQRGLPVRRMIRWFGEDGATGWQARPELARRVIYRQHNLLVDAPPAGRFEMIFCRNVLLYFSPSVRRQVLDRLAHALRPGGLLVLGAGETVIGQTDALVPSERFRGLYRAADAERPFAVAMRR